jgi:hypothetical protein
MQRQAQHGILEEIRPLGLTQGKRFIVQGGPSRLSILAHIGRIRHLGGKIQQRFCCDRAGEYCCPGRLDRMTF